MGTLHKSAYHNLRPSFSGGFKQAKSGTPPFAKGPDWLREQLIRVHTIT